MKLAHITKWPPADGIGNYAYHLTRHFRRAGMETTVFTTDASDPKNKVFRFGKSVKDILKLFSDLRELSPDIVHIQYYTGKYGTAFGLIFPLLKMFGIRYTLTLHEPLSRTLRDLRQTFGPLSLLLSPLIAAYEMLFVYGFAQKIFVHSDVVARDLSSRGFSSVRLPYYATSYIWNWPSLRSHRKRFKKSRKVDYVLGYAGFIVPRKNLLLAIDAAERFHKRNPRSMVLVVGGLPGKGFYQAELYNRYYEQVRDRIANSNMRVEMTGLIGERSFLDKLRNCDVLLAPFEGVAQSSTIVSAMTCGVPIVASRDSGLKIVGSERIGYNTALNAESFDKAVEKTVKSRAYDRMCARCVELARTKYSWRETAGRYLGVFRALSGKK